MYRKTDEEFEELKKNWFSHFISECCETDRGYIQPSGELYTAYRSWANGNGTWAKSTGEFYGALDGAGFDRRRTRKGSFIRGLRLKRK